MANNGYNRNYNRNYRSGNTDPRRRKRRNRKRLRNRIIIVASFLAVIFLIILLFFLIIRGCSGGNSYNAQPETTASDGSQNVDDTGFSQPVPEDNGAEAQLKSGSLLIWNNCAFELFKGTDDTAAGYSNALNSFAESIGGSLKIYSMVVPSHTEMVLPDRLKSGNGYATASQSENITAINGRLSSGITPVNCYNALSRHSGEYIYFNSDGRWTGLGAYYAYRAFAESTNQQALPIENCSEKKIEGFKGALYGDGVSEDTVSYFTLPYEAAMDVTAGGKTEHYGSLYCEDEKSGKVFINGDNPLTVLKANNETGKKIAVVKDSFGSAFAPYLTYNYDEAHIIDYRYWEGSLAAYCKENGISEVLFINGISSANDEMQVKAMEALF